VTFKGLSVQTHRLPFYLRLSTGAEGKFFSFSLQNSSGWKRKLPLLTSELGKTHSKV